MTSIMTLDTLEVGAKAIIKKVAPTLKSRTRYASMGLIRNSAIEVLRIAPLGDPMIIRIMGYELSLRLEEASHIEIERINTL